MKSEFGVSYIKLLIKNTCKNLKQLRFNEITRDDQNGTKSMGGGEIVIFTTSTDLGGGFEDSSPPPANTVFL